MSRNRNREYIMKAFEIYNLTMEIALEVNRKAQQELFNKLIELNNKHLIENLDKALNLSTDNVEK